MKKRIIWAALVCALLLCAALALAEETCTHANTYQSTSWDYISYESTGDVSTHLVTYDEYQITFCSDCGSWLGRELLREDVTQEEEHSWGEEGSCVCCEQENTCAHANTTEHTSWQNHEYESTGDVGAHLLIYDVYLITVCSDCHLELEATLEKENVTEENWHIWSSGVCQNCNQLNACTHPNPEYQTYETNHTYAATGDIKTHSATFDKYERLYCPDCHLSYADALLEEGVTADRDHGWNGDGLCWDCGQENTCAHEENNTHTFHENAVCQSTGDLRTHTVTYDAYEELHCRVCGMWHSRTLAEAGRTETQSHTWNEEGVCDTCGQKNACPHESSERNTYDEDFEYKSTGDVGTHIAIFDQVEKTYCFDCGLYFDETLIAEGVQRAENHSWNDEGICWSCDQENTCEHENAQTQTYEDNHTYESTGDLAAHTKIYDRYKRQYCPDCHLYYGDMLLEIGATIAQEHFWSDEGTCHMCGQVNACPHENTRNYTIGRNAQHVSTGDLLTHAYSYDRYELVRCDDCGMTISDTFVETVTYDYRHDWNEEGICGECGQENTCVHLHTTDSVYTSADRYETMDDAQHTHTFMINIATTCDDCGLRLSQREEGEHTLREKHVWSSDGQCYACEAPNPCAHEETETRESRSGEEYTDLGDGLNHHVVARVRLRQYCTACGIRVGGVQEETREYDEPHESLYNCDACGYTAECAHAGETYTVTDWVDMRWEALDDWKHAAYGKLEEHVCCLSCNEELAVTLYKTEKQLEVSKHYWDDDGVCEDCGLENPCSHMNTSAYLLTTEGSGWTALDANRHSRTVVYYERQRCSDCGVSLGRIGNIFEDTITSRHEFYEGACDACGYKNPCAHDGETHTAIETWDWWHSESVDDTTHRLDCEARESTICDLCGECIAYVELERAWREFPHVMYGSVCDWCGYTNGCAHENVREEIRPDTYNPRICTYLSDAVHESTYNLYRYEYCEDCDTLLENRGSTFAGMTTIEEAHDMAGGVCVPCGYEGAERIESRMIVYAAGEVPVYDQPYEGAPSSSVLAAGSLCVRTATKGEFTELSSGGWVRSGDIAVIDSREAAAAYAGSEEALFAEYAMGDTGKPVIFLQAALSCLEYYEGDLTGHFGTLTQRAVMAFRAAQGLMESGVCDGAAMERLITAVTGDGSGTSAHAVFGDTVYNLDWTAHEETLCGLGLGAGAAAILTDLRTDLSMYLYIQGLDGHIDAEPLTAGDTAALCAMFGVGDADSIDAQARPMVLTLKTGYGDLHIAASIYATPHGTQTITDNDYAGQLCVYFSGSLTHGTNVVVERHEQAIAEAVSMLTQEGRTVKTTLGNEDLLPFEPDFVLPSALKRIEAEAFAQSAFAAVLCPQGLEEIGAWAFADCVNLRQIAIPASVTLIAPDAFEGCGELTIFGEADSAAESFAEENGFAFFARALWE